ncbi:serine hydrolase domain-containing protein [Allokutzneria oryzae]|uniref:Serine hydrolase domain-containing protein n=1 Tax=Allokutzneria oryzae TaxID=1378989 RepID=A0ABV6A502_9PSEU
MSRRLAELGESHSVPGAQLAVHHDGRSVSVAVGEAEHGSGRPLTEEAKVPVGSVSKTFTAALALALVADGDLELDEPIAEYLPELRRVAAELGDEVTVRHLLSHTSGLPSDAEDLSATSLRRHAVNACRTLVPVGAAGTGFSYSNIGYVLVGGIVEAVTGMSWREAVDAVLAAPLGLDLRYTAGDGAGGFVTGHAVRTSPHRVRPVRQSLTGLDAPAGAVAASAADLVVLGRMLLGDGPGLIDDEVLLEMRESVAHAEPFGMADGWGLGLAQYTRRATTWFGHDGTSDGTSAHLRVCPASGTVVAVTANGSTGYALWQEFAAEFGLGDYAGPAASSAPSCRVPAPRDCLGRYVNGDLEYAVTDAGGGRLALAVDGEPFAELTPLDGLVFAMRDVDTGDTGQTGRFLTGPTGGIDRIQVGGRLARRRRQAQEVA